MKKIKEPDMVGVSINAKSITLSSKKSFKKQHKRRRPYSSIRRTQKYNKTYKKTSPINIYCKNSTNIKNKKITRPQTARYYCSIKNKPKQQPLTARINVKTQNRSRACNQYQTLPKSAFITKRNLNKNTTNNKLCQSLHKLYPTRNDFAMNYNHRPDDISRAIRLNRQYCKTLQKRSKQINTSTKPKFQTLLKNISCYDMQITAAKDSLMESPYISSNPDLICYRSDYQPSEHRNVARWDLRMYDRLSRFDHLATGQQMVSNYTTERYEKIESIMGNIYRHSVKDFFGKKYNLKTGLDPEYLDGKQQLKKNFRL